MFVSLPFFYFYFAGQIFFLYCYFAGQSFFLNSFLFIIFWSFMKNCIVIYFDDEDKDSIIKFLDNISDIAEWFKIHFKKDFAKYCFTHCECGHVFGEKL